MRVILSGQRSFGAAVLQRLMKAHDVTLVVAPGAEDRLAIEANKRGLLWSPSTVFDSEVARAHDADVLVAAHSHAFIGRKTRAAVDWAIGYHPSLLPRHRGRDAVRWTVKMGDPIAGGSVYVLTDNVDGGPIVCQDWCHVDPAWDHHALWRERLFPMGVDLLEAACARIEDEGPSMAVTPQDEKYASWEPSWEREPIHRPELWELPSGD